MESLIQSQGIHHITLNGANRETSINFWQNILGMRLVFEQPNLDDTSINHLYFDSGDGSTTITVFTDENRLPLKSCFKNKIGSIHHLAFSVSQNALTIAEKNLRENGFSNTGIKDRGFMDSLYFREPLGLLIELACYKFEPPLGLTHVSVLNKAQDLRLKRKANNIENIDISTAIKQLKNTG